jgi:hypothetical protein
MTMAVKTTLALGVAIILGTAAAALAASPYGSPGELQQCVAKMAPSGRSAGPGDLDDLGVTEFDVMVGRCLSLINRPRPPGRQPR